MPSFTVRKFCNKSRKGRRIQSGIRPYLQKSQPLGMTQSRKGKIMTIVNFFDGYQLKRLITKRYPTTKYTVKKVSALQTDIVSDTGKVKASIMLQNSQVWIKTSRKRESLGYTSGTQFIILQSLLSQVYSNPLEVKTPEQVRQAQAQALASDGGTGTYSWRNHYNNRQIANAYTQGYRSDNQSTRQRFTPQDEHIRLSAKQFYAD